MSRYGALEVNVKVFKTNAEPSATAKGGVYQLLGNCRAEIKVIDQDLHLKTTDEVVLFHEFSGRINRSFRTVEDFENNTKVNLIIDFSNSYKNATNNQYYDQTKPSDKLQAILEVETMKALGNGFSESEHDQNTAKNAGIDLKDYNKISQDCMTAIASIGRTMPQDKETTNKENSKTFDKEMSDTDSSQVG